MTTALKLPRNDIQALRGLAVLMVVLYHAKIGGFKAGFLGVDIFFVISGFLITTLVANGIHDKTFRLSDFYFRRAKRLLPTAYVTFLITAMCAPWFLNQQELRDFASQLVGAITFTGNIVLWQQTGYFEGTSDLKPLLHVWSLALEEQYYFLLPAALLLTRQNRWFWGTMTMLLLSLALCTAGSVFKPVANFYLLPTRGWELLIGSIGALWALRPQERQSQNTSGLVNRLFIPGVLCLLALPFFPVTGGHPGVSALLVCIATVVVILKNSQLLNAAWPTRALAVIGDFSYSLYLVHWPIMAFMKNAWVGTGIDPPPSLRWLTLGLSFGLAYLLYRWVERPIRRSKLTLSRPLFMKAALSSVVLMSITPMAMQASPAQTDYRAVRKPNFGFSETCDYTGRFEPRRECQNSAEPTLLVWGDSYAMHLVPGLAQEWKSAGVIQATMSSCGPILGMAPRRLVHTGHGNVMDLAWAKRCIAFNQSVIDYLRAAPSIHTVVLSSPFSAYVTAEHYEHVRQVSQEFLSVPTSHTAAQTELRHTVEAVRSLGKKVVLIAPPPSSDFDIGGCLERQISGTIVLGGHDDCNIDRMDYHTKRANVLDLLRVVSNAANVGVIRFDPYLCGSRVCDTLREGTLIYRDGGHLSYAGSKLLAKRMQLATLVMAQAK